MELFSFLAAFTLSFITTPYAARYLFRKGITGIDLHKEGEIKIPELGGITIYLAVLAVLLFHLISGVDVLLYPTLAIVIIGLLGIIDGFKRLSAFQKVSSFFAVGILLSLGLGYTDLLALALLGFLFMASVNFTNMLAGFNGLEIGTGAIASIGLAVVSYHAGEVESFLISSTMAGALLAFLYFNRFPASVFPGDVGTLIIGSALFSTVIIGRLYVPGVLVFTPYIVDAALKFLSAGVMTRETQKPTIVKEGKLYVPEGTNLSLPRIFLRRKAMPEKDVALRVWTIELIFGAAAVLYEVGL